MTVRHLQIYIAVYQQMNITRAAESLHLTQPAVSRAIQELESYYHIRLFERIKRRLFRNVAADEFYARALHIVESFHDIEAEFNNWDEFATLRVGASITLGNYFLPLIIKRYQEKVSGNKINVKISNTESIQQMLLDNQVDLALVEGNISSEFLHKEQLGEDRMVLILSPDHPLLQLKRIRLKDVAGYPLLLREPGSAGRTFLNNVFDVHEIEISPAWESTSTQALVKAVACGFGISILPEQLVLNDIASGAVATRTVDDASFARKNYVVWHSQKYLAASAKEFIAMCHAVKVGEANGR